MTSPELLTQGEPQAGEPRGRRGARGSTPYAPPALAPHFRPLHISSYVSLSIQLLSQLQLSPCPATPFPSLFPLDANDFLLLHISKCLSIPCLFLNLAPNSINSFCIKLLSLKLLERVLILIRAIQAHKRNYIDMVQRTNVKNR